MSLRQPMRLSDDWRENETKLASVTREIERVKRDLENASRTDRRWEALAADALRRYTDEGFALTSWLVNHDRDLLKRAAKLLQTLADEGTDLSAVEYELIKRLVDRAENL